MWVQLPYQRQKGGRQYVEAHWGEAQAALELLEALIEETDKLQSKVDVHVSPRKYRKEFFWSIINSPGIALRRSVRQCAQSVPTVLAKF